MHLLLTYSVDFHRAAPWDKCYPLSGGISTGIFSELDKFRGKAAHKLSLKHSLAKLTGFPWRQHFNDDTPKKKIRQKKLNKRKLATFLLIHNSFIVRVWWFYQLFSKQANSPNGKPHPAFRPNKLWGLISEQLAAPLFEN